MAGTATITIGDTQWQVSIASTYDELAAGLGGLSSIPAGTGMLFVFSSEQSISVTTHPMLFDLDIIFLDTDLVVTSVEKNVAPGQIIPGNGQYFLEVNAGEAENVQVGDQAQVTELPPTDSLLPVIGTLMMALVCFGMLTAGFSVLEKY